jgi:hypothetical protein
MKLVSNLFFQEGLNTSTRDTHVDLLNTVIETISASTNTGLGINVELLQDFINVFLSNNLAILEKEFTILDGKLIEMTFEVIAKSGLGVFGNGEDGIMELQMGPREGINPFN